MRTVEELQSCFNLNIEIWAYLGLCPPVYCSNLSTRRAKCCISNEREIADCSEVSQGKKGLSKDPLKEHSY